MDHDCPPAVAVMSPRAATTSAFGFGGVVFRLGISSIARRTREHQAQLLLMFSGPIWHEVSSYSWRSARGRCVPAAAVAKGWALKSGR